MERLILVEKPKRVKVLCPKAEMATDMQVRQGRVIIRGD